MYAAKSTEYKKLALQCSVLLMCCNTSHVHIMFFRRAHFFERGFRAVPT
jgi:hypothetical protein